MRNTPRRRCRGAGPGEKLPISRDAHRSVIAAAVVNGVQPVWVHPEFDAERRLAHPPEPDDVRGALTYAAPWRHTRMPRERC